MATTNNSDETSGSAKTAEPAKKGKLKRVLIALLATGLAVGGGAAYFLTRQKAAHPAEEAAMPLEVPVFVTLEPFTVNLQPNSRSRFLHVGIAIKVPDVKTQGQVNQYLPEVRSRVLMVLSNRLPEALISPEDKNKLSVEITSAINTPFAPKQPSIKVSGVMFTTFMLQ